MSNLEFRPFSGLRYPFEHLSDTKTLLSPPYDIISPDKQQRLLNSNPHNMVHVDFGPQFESDNETNNRYTRAAKTVAEWVKAQIWIRDAVPAYYVYAHSYPTPSGEKTLIGIIGMARLAPFEEGLILPHEKTLPGPITDRFELMKATQTSLSQVFTIFDDPENRIESLIAPIQTTAPLLDSPYGDNERVKVWRLTDPLLVSEIQQVMQTKKLLIADGHHRYTTALHYRDYARAQGALPDAESEYGLIFAANLHSTGLTIYPTHRVCVGLSQFNEANFLAALAAYFDIFSATDEAEMLRVLPTVLPRVGLGLVLPGGYRVLALRTDVDFSRFWPADTHPVLRELDVFVLQQIVLIGVLGLTLEDIAQQKHVRYIKETPQVSATIAAGDAQVGFLMNPTRLTQMRDLCLAGVRMPQKSTFFYPKLVTGTVMASVAPDRKIS